MGDERQCGVGSKKARVPDRVENAKKCACPMCPTFGRCMENKGDRLYCARGASECPVRRSGCICGECAVALDYGLASNYYCDGGMAKF